MPGFVYVLYSDDGLRKIGSTRNFTKRVAQIAPKMPYRVRLELLFACDTGKERQVEVMIHRIFRHKRLQGEWFNLDGDDLAFLFENDLLDLPIRTERVCRNCGHTRAMHSGKPE